MADASSGALNEGVCNVRFEFDHKAEMAELARDAPRDTVGTFKLELCQLRQSPELRRDRAWKRCATKEGRFLKKRRNDQGSTAAAEEMCTTTRAPTRVAPVMSVSLNLSSLSRLVRQPSSIGSRPLRSTVSNLSFVSFVSCPISDGTVPVAREKASVRGRGGGGGHERASCHAFGRARELPR